MRGMLLLVIIAVLFLGPSVLVALGPVWVIALLLAAIGWVITSLPERK
jgi:hypothetical protein